MSPTIRIDDDVFGELKKHAEPFVDTPNSVLRRLLGLGDADARAEALVDGADAEKGALTGAGSQPRTRQRRKRGRQTKPPRARSGSILSEAAYEIPMLRIIADHGGRAAAREVLDELETRLDGQLTEVDREMLASGNVRWRNRAQFVRLRLVEQGDMVSDSPRGIWEISDQGRRRLAADAA